MADTTDNPAGVAPRGPPPHGDHFGVLAGRYRLAADRPEPAAGQVRIVIPTVYRSNYLARLAGVSNRNGRGETLVSVLQFAQRWTGAMADPAGNEFCVCKEQE